MISTPEGIVVSSILTPPSWENTTVINAITEPFKFSFDCLLLPPVRCLSACPLKLRQLTGMPANLQGHLLPPLLTPQYPTLSQLDPPAEISVFSSPLLLGLLIALGFYLFCTTSANRFDEILHEDRHSEALTALMAIFTPTKSSWPSDVLYATRRASASRSGRGFVSSAGSSRPVRGEIRLGFSAVYEHILNGDLELQSTASVDLVKAMLLERDGMEVDGWKIKVVVEWKWVWRVSLWVVKGLGSRLVNLSELWNGDVQKVISRPCCQMYALHSDVVDRLRTCWVRHLPRMVLLHTLTPC